MKKYQIKSNAALLPDLSSKSEKYWFNNTPMLLEKTYPSVFYASKINTQMLDAIARFCDAKEVMAADRAQLLSRLKNMGLPSKVGSTVVQKKYNALFEYHLTQYMKLNKIIIRFLLEHKQYYPYFADIIQSLLEPDQSVSPNIHQRVERDKRLPPILSNNREDELASTLDVHEAAEEQNSHPNKRQRVEGYHTPVPPDLIESAFIPSFEGEDDLLPVKLLELETADTSTTLFSSRYCTFFGRSLRVVSPCDIHYKRVSESPPDMSASSDLVAIKY